MFRIEFSFHTILAIIAKNIGITARFQHTFWGLTRYGVCPQNEVTAGISGGRQVVTILWGLRELHFWRRFGENLQIGRNGGVDAGRAQRLKSASYSSVLKILLILSKPSALRRSIRRLMLQTSARGFRH